MPIATWVSVDWEQLAIEGADGVASRLINTSRYAACWLQPTDRRVMQ